MANITTAMLAIDEIDRITDDQWKLRLNERKRKELEFHDRSRSRQFESDTAVAQDTYEKFYGNRKYYIATRRSDEYAKSWIEKNARGKIFLDFACGNGENALRAARAGAAFSLGFDISPVSVRNATLRARSEALGNIRFFQADAEDTRLPDACVDVIVCSGMLHHLDLSYAIPELRRILKPGGRVLVGEALDYNPAIKLYRMLTPEMRTEWEKAHILSLKDVEFASRFLDVADVRYWHVVGYIAGKFPALHHILEPIDKLLERIPYIQRMAWIFTFELRKPL